MDSSKRIKTLLKRQTKEFGEWNDKPANIEGFWVEPQEALALYADNGEGFGIARQSAYLHSWHFNKLGASVLVDKKGLPDEFAQAARYAMWTVLLKEPLARQDRTTVLLKDKAAYYLSLQIIAGWQHETVAVGDALREGLDTPLLDLRINDRHDSGTLFPHFWFLMHLYGAWRGLKPIDVSLYSYPDSLGPYEAVLANWRTPDVQQVKAWVEAMAEHHVQQTDDRDPYGKKEFDFDDVMLFPYEIFAYLRLREWMGLPNPSQFDHPLMNQPMGRFPPPLGHSVADTPLMQRVVARYRQNFPDLRTVG